jgi:hypothetical protein
MTKNSSRLVQPVHAALTISRAISQRDMRNETLAAARNVKREFKKRTEKEAR